MLRTRRLCAFLKYQTRLKKNSRGKNSRINQQQSRLLLINLQGTHTPAYFTLPRMVKVISLLNEQQVWSWTFQNCSFVTCRRKNKQECQSGKENLNKPIEWVHLMEKLQSYSHRLDTWACIIKLFTAVIYGFHNKLECLSLASLSSLVHCLRTITILLRKPWITAVISFMIQAPGKLFMVIINIVQE